MVNAISKSMFVRKVTDREYKKVAMRMIMEFAGQVKRTALGDTMVAFEEKAVKYGMYKVEGKPY